MSVPVERPGVAICEKGEKIMRTKRIYEVTFCTQKDRRYITWGILISAYNQKDAKVEAELLWYNKDNPHQRSKGRFGIGTDHPHMFHTTASRYAEDEESKELSTFYIIKNEAVTWGYKR